MNYWTQRIQPAGPTVAAIWFLWVLTVGVCTHVGLMLL